jgi:para-aminobenzoate synthetase
VVLEYDVQDGVVTRHTADGVFKENGSIFHVLDRELESRAIEPLEDPDHGLLGGFVGYLGYECKGDCGATNAHVSDVPDAVQMLANRVIAVDHVRGRTHVMALACGEEPDAEGWLDLAERTVHELLATPSAGVVPTSTTQDPPKDQVIFRVGRGREQYLAVARGPAVGAGA